MTEFDTRSCTVGDPATDTSERIPRTIFELCRFGGYDDHDSLAWKLANLSIYNSAITVCLVGLSSADIKELIDFLADYEQRLRDF
jgi:hypothetical protein